MGSKVYGVTPCVNPLIQTLNRNLIFISKINLNICLCNKEFKMYLSLKKSKNFKTIQIVIMRNGF